MTKVIGYVRVSTERQDFTRQQNLIEEYCKLNDLQLVKTIGEKQSGAESERQGYIELQQLSKDDADIIVMTELSRLSREDDIIQPLYHINEILKKGIDMIFLENSIFDAVIYKGGDHLSYNAARDLIDGLEEAKKERTKIKNRLKSGRRNMFVYYPNMCLGKAPFGYKRITNPEYKPHVTPQSLLVRNENAKYIEMIFNWCADGITLENISSKLKAYGIIINSSTIYSILHNEIYKGIWTYMDVIKQGDAIISEELWQKAQKALKVNSDKHKGEKHLHLLKGIIKCGECGHNMSITKRRNNLHYRCISQLNNKQYKDTCSNGSIKASLVNGAVWSAILSSIRTNEFIKATNEELAIIDDKLKDIDNIIISNKNQIKQLKSDMDTLSNRMAKVSNDTLFNSLQDQFIKMDKEYKGLLKDIDQLMQDKGKYLELREQMQSKINDNVIDSMTDEEKAPIIKRYISEVTYYKESINKGFILVTFKNGMEIIYVSLPKKLLQLPSGFEFDKETRKAKLLVMKNAPTLKPFSMDLQTESIEYDAASFEEDDNLSNNDILTLFPAWFQ